MPENLVNWENLKPYLGKKSKSFEELCFQICFEEYHENGKLVSIDDSGGGDGVEFYLELSNGDVWGWQCKFFGRLNEGGRKEQIKHSLQRAVERHGDSLKQWTLCSQLSLTPEELDWYKSIGFLRSKGKTIFPEGFTLELHHWGDSEILNYLRKYTGIHKFFFTENFLDNEWFTQKLNLLLESSVIKSKYLEELHTKGDADKQLSEILGDNELERYIEQHEKQLNVSEFNNQYKKAIEAIERGTYRKDFPDIYDEIKALFDDEKKSIIERGIAILKNAKKLIRKGNRHELVNYLPFINQYGADLTHFYLTLKEYRDIEKSEPIHWDTEEIEKDRDKKNDIRNCRNTLLGPFFTFRNYIEPFSDIFDKFRYLNFSEVHISGGASKGKTHLMVNLSERQIKSGKPAIFLFGKDFISESPFAEQIKGILDIPATWSFEDFLSALNVAGRINDTKTLLIIDGLNEAIHWKSIWFGIENFCNDIKSRYTNILFVISYRTSYRDQLFPENYFEHTVRGKLYEIEMSGFENGNLREAIDKYISYHNITLLNHSQAIMRFKEPLYLKIFCQTKSGQTVSFQHEDLFDVLDQFIFKTNGSIISKLKRDIRFNKNFLQNSLDAIATYLWDNNARDIPLNCVIPGIFTVEEFFMVESEDLLVFREWHDIEVITFVYDLLSGYLIAKELIKKIETLEALYLFYNSQIFEMKLLNWETRHPLFEDIIRSLNILALKQFGPSIYHKTDSQKSKTQIMECLFEVNETVISYDVHLIKSIISSEFITTDKRKKIFKLFTNTEFNPNHPLNGNFLSDLLLSLTVSERDLSWTEYVRESYGLYSSGNLYQLLSNFPKKLRQSEIVTEKNHLQVKKIMWCLTSTNRTLRDNATKALYYFARVEPEYFLKLAVYSLKCNDPYLWERTLGVLYGALLYLRSVDAPSYNEFSAKSAKTLYQLLFIPGAVFGTTHILAREYASRSIQLVLMQQDKLLTNKEKKNIFPPYKHGGIRDYGEFPYEESERLSIDPIHIDFSNYTIGNIVKDGHSYSNPPLKKKVRKQIYWRIFNLGWNVEQFGSIDDYLIRNGSREEHERAKVERYGKKYSWIGYYEVAGLLQDKKLLENQWDYYRKVDADIDLSFPKKARKKRIIHENLLGEPEETLINWFRRKDPIELSQYFESNNLIGDNSQWICLDGYCSQKDNELERKMFVFIRTMMVKKTDYAEFINLLDKQYVGGRWLPEVIQNETAFAGELHIMPGAAATNETEISFITDSKEIEIGAGHPEYDMYNIFEQLGLPTEKDRKHVKVENKTTNFNVLLPVMDYHSGAKSLDIQGHQTTLSKEIGNAMQLNCHSEHLDTFDTQGKLASVNFRYKAKNESQRFTYLRKDILNKYLSDNDYNLVYCVWGERELNFKDFTALQSYRRENDIDNFQVFKSISTYQL